MGEAESISCPHCGQVFTVAPGQMAQYLGQSINCTRCKQPFTVGALPQQPGAMAPPPLPNYQSAMDQPARSTSAVAVTALVLGILSFIIPILASIAAIVCGIVGINKTGPGKKNGRGIAITGLVLGGVTLVFMPCMIGILLPALGKARQAANEIKCANNLKQIGLACVMYSNAQTDGAFPDTLDKLIVAGPLNADVFVCPSSHDRPSTAGTPQLIAVDLGAGGHDSYIYLGAGIKSSTSADTVLAYEPIGDHRKGSNILFADGRVEFLATADVQQLISALSLGKNPPPFRFHPMYGH